MICLIFKYSNIYSYSNFFTNENMLYGMYRNGRSIRLPVAMIDLV